MVTVLDAHPDIAMSYELYPTLLKPLMSGRLSPQDFKEMLLETIQGREMKALPENKMVKTFIDRCPRGGISKPDLLSVLDDYCSEGYSFQTIGECLRFIEKCAVMKMVREGKKRWGLKCNSAFDAYLDLWPKACFLNMVRDGRDVLASQMNTGAFNPSPADLGISWSKVHKKFRKLVNDPSVNAFEVFYEELVVNPEDTLKVLCRSLGVNYHENMLNYHENDLTIFDASHLSMERIKKSIDASKIGRWKEELASEQLEGFMSTAGQMMKNLGYLEADCAD